MLKRNPDAPIFCDGPDDAPAGVCSHCGGASEAEYCGLECRLKASEAAASKRIAALEAKLEELSAKEQMREGAERAAEEDARVVRETYEAHARMQEEIRREAFEQMRQMQRLSPRPSYLDDYLRNCIPSRASLLVDRNRTTQSPAAPTARAWQSYDNREWAMWAMGLMVVMSGVGSIVGLS